jgi:hypothetical protein
MLQTAAADRRQSSTASATGCRPQQAEARAVIDSGCGREQSLAEARAVIDSECDRLQTAAAVELCEEGGTEVTPW